MKKFINLILTALSPFAAVPTGWAIYAGVTGQPAFPMNPYAAGIGAVAVIATSIAAGLLIADIATYNQSMKNKTEREELGMSTLPAWLIFLGCVLAEITLSLLIVVIPGALVFGVLVFPLMTAAGVFAFAVRFDLWGREVCRENGRAEIEAKEEAEQAKAEAEQVAAKAEIERAKAELKAERKQRQAEKLAIQLAQAKAEPATSQPQPAPAEVKPAFVCSCGKEFATQPALNAHKRAHKQVAGYAVSFEPITKEQVKQ
jgi:hypothetical protein